MRECLGSKCKGCAKICILIIIKRGWQCFGFIQSLHQAEDTSRFKLFCFIPNCLQRKRKHLCNLSKYRTVAEKKLIKLFIQYWYEYLSTKSHSRSVGRVGVLVGSPSTDREVGSLSPHALKKFWVKQSVIWH